MSQHSDQPFVKDLLRVRHSHVVCESAALRDVAERFIISDCDVMAVVDEQQQLIGVVCEASVVRALLASPPENATIQTIVVRHAESVRLDATLTTVLPHFRSAAHTALPVVNEDGCVCGLLMRRDVLASLLNQNSADASRQKDSISAPPARVIRDRTAATANLSSAPLLPEHGSSTSSQPAGPHFLRSDAARRILWSAAEDRL